MKDVHTTSVLIRDEKGAVLFIIDRNKLHYNEDVKIVSNTYYQIGSALYIKGKKYKITDLQFIHRDDIADFQTTVTVRNNS